MSQLHTSVIFSRRGGIGGLDDQIEIDQTGRITTDTPAGKVARRQLSKEELEALADTLNSRRLAVKAPEPMGIDIIEYTFHYDHSTYHLLQDQLDESSKSIIKMLEERIN